MRSLPEYILEQFWEKWPAIRRDRVDLAGRLARRHRVQLHRPPRAHCIPLRANDTRLNPFNVSMILRTQYERRAAHTVILHGVEIRPLLDLVMLDPGGETVHDAAAKLGSNAQGLKYLMRKGFFRIRRIAGYGGARCKPIPFLYSDQWLDPCTRSFLPPDPIWGSITHYRRSALPADFEQDIRREPLISRSRFGTIFKGWQWRCPACNQPCETVYFPMPVPHVEEYLRIKVSNLDTDAPPSPLPRFACKKCHHISYTNRCTPQGWNEYVCYLTCGLLYGHEIAKPPWWHVRKTPYHPKPLAKPSARRAEICDYLLNTDLMQKEIAQDTGLTKNTVTWYVGEVYKQYGVHSRKDLRKRVKMLAEEKAAEPTEAFRLRIAGEG